MSRRRVLCVRDGWAGLALSDWRTFDDREGREGESLERRVRTGVLGAPRDRADGVHPEDEGPRCTIHTADVHAGGTPRGERALGRHAGLGTAWTWGLPAPAGTPHSEGAGSSRGSSSETPGLPSRTVWALGALPRARAPQGDWRWTRAFLPDSDARSGGRRSGGHRFRWGNRGTPEMA